MKTYSKSNIKNSPKNIMLSSALDVEIGEDDTSTTNPSVEIDADELEMGEDFNGLENGESGTLYGSNDELAELITCFLKHNSTPSDQQIHSLAFALGIDKETLEAQMYEMLSEFENEEGEQTMASLRVWASIKLEALTEDEEVLDDEYDPNLTNTDSLILNDGNPDPEENELTQDDLRNDGSVEPIDDEKEVILNDGVLMPPSL